MRPPEGPPSGDKPSDDAAVFEAQRPRLLRLGYRMLGSTAEAEDVVQDAWLRWQRADHSAVREPAAFLTRTVTRLCLDVMRSARQRRETYVGSWLPEPLVEPEPEAETVRADELTLTLMLALERLSPLERAAFLLHDVFDVPLAEVATTLDRDAAAVRQLAARARKHVRTDTPRYQVQREEGDRLAQAFFTASSSGDIAGLRTLLAQSVVVQSDGGGKIHAFLNPIVGLAKVLRLYDGLRRKLIAQKAEFITPAWIDGLPGYISRERDGVLQTTAFAIENGLITTIYITRNPEKLQRVAEAVSTPAGAALH
jgi:RNA polymerase sigma-70 factor (ECF subfamily)